MIDYEFAYTETGLVCLPKRNASRISAKSLVFSSERKGLFLRTFYATRYGLIMRDKDKKIRTLSEANQTIAMLHNTLNEYKGITLDGLYSEEYPWMRECERRRLISDYEFVQLLAELGYLKN